MSQWSLFQLLDDVSMIEVLDIGASLGEKPSYQKLIDVNRARLTGFEPDPDECARLAASHGAPHRFFPIFVGDGRSSVFHKTNWAATGSLFEPNTPLLEKFRNLSGIATPLAEMPVETTRLDDFLPVDDVDFLKIDAQGAELGIFQNARRILEKTLVIQTEVSFVEFYKGQPMFSDVDAFLRANGFQYHTINGYGYRPFTPLINPRNVQEGFNQHIWGDAIYVRDWMHLGAIATEKLARYAVILNDIIESFDLAYVMLAELDRRSGSILAPQYLRRLLDWEMADYSWHEHNFGLTPSVESGSSVVEVPPPVVNPPITLETNDGLQISCPAELDSITTYVLLEQKRWFEKEAAFVGKCLVSGATAIDVGANLGFYSLTMARTVGPAGHVYAFEPGTANRTRLQTSIRINQFDNITVLPDALSDKEKTGWLSIAASGELNSLVDAENRTANVERVAITTLDLQSGLWQDKSIDFIKIDAEGQEQRIIAGGGAFFRNQSPLVMFEIKNGETPDDSLCWMFRLLGYDIFRLIANGSLLVPFYSDERIDSFELNLFAAKPDRALKLADAGLLSRGGMEFRLSATQHISALETLLRQPYARSLDISLDDIETCSMANALACYAAFLYLDGLSVDQKYAVLCEAFDRLHALAQQEPSPAVLATYARVANDLGRRSVAVVALAQIASMTEVALDQPFFPPSPRFDRLEADADIAQWFLSATLEQQELLGAYSSFYAQNLPRLKWLCTRPEVSAEIIRRTILVAGMHGMPESDMASYRCLLSKQEPTDRLVMPDL